MDAGQGNADPLHFLTAYAKFQYAQEAVRLGGFDYIMQPAPYGQVVETVERALREVRDERASQELQTRGALFDRQKKEIAATLLRDVLTGAAAGGNLKAFEEIGLFPPAQPGLLAGSDAAAGLLQAEISLEHAAAGCGS